MNDTDKSQEDLLNFVNDPKNIAKAAEGSMEKRQVVFDKSEIPLRDYIGMAMYGFKYHDYCRTPMTEPKGKYPYPGAIDKLDKVMAYIDEHIQQRCNQARIDELAQNFLDTDETCMQDVVTKKPITVKQRKDYLYECIEKK